MTVLSTQNTANQAPSTSRTSPRRVSAWCATATATATAATAAPPTRTDRGSPPYRDRDSPRARASATTSARSRLAQLAAWVGSRNVSAGSGTTPLTARPATRSSTLRSYAVSSPSGGRRRWMVVCMTSLPGWRNSRYFRAARSSRVDSAASSVTSQWLTSRLTTAGGSWPPRSWVGGPGCAGRGRVTTTKTPHSTNQPPIARTGTASSNTSPGVTTPGPRQNRTLTSARSSPAASKYGSIRKPPMPATMFVGMDWIAAFSDWTELL